MSFDAGGLLTGRNRPQGSKLGIHRIQHDRDVGTIEDPIHSSIEEAFQGAVLERQQLRMQADSDRMLPATKDDVFNGVQKSGICIVFWYAHRGRDVMRSKKDAVNFRAGDQLFEGFHGRHAFHADDEVVVLVEPLEKSVRFLGQLRGIGQGVFQQLSLEGTVSDRG